MIIRQLITRNGRACLRPSTFRTTRRFLSAEVDSISSSLQNSSQETRSIESALNSSYDDLIPAASGTTRSDAVGEDYREFKRQKELLGGLGGSVGSHYQPHILITNPPRPSDVTLELLLASQSHLGHATSLWNPANSKYIFGIRDGIHIISLEVTASHLRRAAKVVKAVAERGGLILFAGTRAGQDRCVVKAAELAGGCHLFERWIPGSITNGLQILGQCKVKVVDEFDQGVDGFEEQLIEREALKPDLVVCLNPLENWVLLHECALNNIPTVGIIDTDANPTWVTYPIPANDDSLRCVQVICGVLGRAAEQGRERRLELAKSKNISHRERVTFGQAHNLKPPGTIVGSMDDEENVLRLRPTPEDMYDIDRKIEERRAKRRAQERGDESTAGADIAASQPSRPPYTTGGPGETIGMTRQSSQRGVADEDVY